MPEYDNKLQRFEEAIMKRANARRNAILKEIEDLQAAEVKSAEEAYLQDTAKRVKGELSEIGESYNREYARRTAAFRREMLTRRETITNEVFAACRQKLMAFAASGEAYHSYMIDLVAGMRDIYPESGCMLFIMDRDRTLMEDLRAAYGGDCEVTVSEDFEIGGVILYHPATGLIVDESLDNALAEQRDYFLEHSGLAGL